MTLKDKNTDIIVNQYFAHSSNKAGSPWEPLNEHLRLVAERAGKYAESFGAKEEAVIAALYHDLGKYSGLFLKRLKGSVSGLDHWSVGAIAVLNEFRYKAIAAALAIQGHHIGLLEGSPPGIKAAFNIAYLSNPKTHHLGLTLTESQYISLLEHFQADGFDLPTPPAISVYDFKIPPVSAMIDARMLFSTLVDADYIETEAHFEGKPDGTKIYRPGGSTLQPQKAFEIVMTHLNELSKNTKAGVSVQKMRKILLEDCLKRATEQSNLFTLTAPTGAGKTLAMLSFALKHAIAKPHLRRIIVIVPFLSIIEQTANVYRQLFEPHLGQHYVLEHHSLAGLKKKNDKCELNRDNEEEARRITLLLAQNWNAPLILTTSVQFFESLFSNLPGKCRKLHRLANSIIMFDEVQTLPPRLAVPSLAALSRLAERYGCTVVFSTATQPAFDHLHDRVEKYALKGWRPQMIVREPLRLFIQARRVRVDWQIKESRTWVSIADEMACEENARSLCIVNLKRHAQKLVEYLRQRVGNSDLFHLSTNMCPAHREKTLDEIRIRLYSESRPCRLISTQCIEAGVDVDFPIAWRAFGPLDAIAQAAGRCNREGKIDGQGQMIVFKPEKEHEKEYLYPPGGYKEATETTETLLHIKENEAKDQGIPFEDTFDISNPELFNQYYRLLYDLTGSTDIGSDLEDSIQRRSFVSVAQHYRLIDQDSINVLVPYAEEMSLFEMLKKQLKELGRLTRQWIQEARPLTVSVYRPKPSDVIWHYLDPVPLAQKGKSDDWFIYLNTKDYDSLLGLKPPNEVEAWLI